MFTFILYHNSFENASLFLKSITKIIKNQYKTLKIRQTFLFYLKSKNKRPSDSGQENDISNTMWDIYTTDQIIKHSPYNNDDNFRNDNDFHDDDNFRDK